MSQDLRTLNSYWSLEEAHLARVELEAGGVRAFVADATTLGMAWHLGGAIHGAKLQVAEDDVEEAMAILGQDSGPGDNLDTETEATVEPEYSGTLENIDSIRQPVIWLLLTPVLIVALAFAILIATSVIEIIQG